MPLLSFDAKSLLIFIAFIISMTFGLLLLLGNKTNKKADRYLAMLVFIVAFWNASILILLVNVFSFFMGIIWVPLKFTLALGPCFYFYVRNMTNLHASPTKQVWLHFIPVTLEVLLFLYQVFVGLPQGKPYFDTEIFILLDPLVNALAILSFIIYGYLGRAYIKKYHLWVKENYSHHHRYNLNWLFRLSNIFIVFLMVWLAYLVIDYYVFDYKLSFADYYPFHLILALISIWLCIEAYSKPDIVFPEQAIVPNIEEPQNDNENHEIKAKAQWLKSEVAKNLLYLDPELSLKSLAEILQIHPNQLSKLINEGLEQSFSDFINGFRVAAVIDKMKDSEAKKMTLLAIAFDCGFNSKTTFNRIFKKFENQTPRQYQTTLKTLK